MASVWLGGLELPPSFTQCWPGLVAAATTPHSAAAAETRLLCWYVMTACEKEYSVLSCYYALSLSLAFVGL